MASADGSTGAPPAGSPGHPAPSDEELTRLVLRVLTAVVVLTLAGGIASASGRLRDAGTTQALDPSPAVPTSPRGGIGPLPGTAVPAYERARGAALSGAGGSRAAVVSFTSYRTAASARAAVQGSTVIRMLVAVPGGRPADAASDADVAVLGRRQRDEATAEKKALEQLLPTVQDPDFRAQYEADIERLGQQLEADEVTEVVFAVVVVAPVERLREMRADRGIRLVDVAAAQTVPGAGSVAGLRPEETARAGSPPTRPTD